MGMSSLASQNHKTRFMVDAGKVPAAKAALAGLSATGEPWLKLARATVSEFQRHRWQALQPTTEATGATQKTVVSEALWDNPGETRAKGRFYRE